MWFSAYAETLIDDIDVKCCSKVVDQNPLGSAAGYGSSLLIVHLPPKRLKL
jgi:argininosuccinate lyase